MSSEGMPTVRLDRSRPGWEDTVALWERGDREGLLNFDGFAHMLAQYGQDGWELVSMMPYGDHLGGLPARLLLVFKRPSDQSPA